MVLLSLIDHHQKNVPYNSNTDHKIFRYLQVTQSPTKLISSYQLPTHQNFYGNSYDQNQYFAPKLSTYPVIVSFIGFPRTICDCCGWPGHHRNSCIARDVTFTSKITQRKIFSSNLSMVMNQKPSLGMEHTNTSCTF